MQKKLLLMILAGVLCLSLVGCGRSGDTQPEEEDTVQTQEPAELPAEELKTLDFLDLNGKDVALNRQETERKTYALAERLQIPVVSGSDTHQALQYGCIRTWMDGEPTEISGLWREMRKNRHRIEIADHAAEQVQNAALLKRTLKEVHALGGNYVSVLLNHRWEEYV